jgi:hypothetical protein
MGAEEPKVESEIKKKKQECFFCPPQEETFLVHVFFPREFWVKTLPFA